MAEVADEVARTVAAEAERMRVDPAATRGEDSDAGAFYLDSEVMRDDRAGQRLWNRLFTHKLDKGAYYDEGKIFDAIGAAYAPAVDNDGRTRAKDAMEIVRDLRGRLQEHAKQTLGKVLDEMGFDLRYALDLEARYVATGGAGAVGAAAGDDKRLDAVPQPKCSATWRTSCAAWSTSVCCWPTSTRPRATIPRSCRPMCSTWASPRATRATKPTSLRQLVRGAATGVDFIDGWNEDDVIVFYRALLGVPLYFYKRVNDELYNSYRAVKAKPERAYPLHIEAAWEDGIPNLDPKELRESEEKRRAEEAAQRTMAERDDKIWSFVLSTMAAAVQKNSDGSYDWVMEEVRKKLGKDRAASFTAFWILDPSLRDDLVAAGVALHNEKTATAVGRKGFRGDLEAYLATVRKLNAAALADEDEGAQKYLKEEKRVIEAKLKDLPPA